jgi:hypothetical protein
MPIIDVSELLSDPDFVQDFTVIRYTRSMVNGRVVDTSGSFPAVGSIQPSSGATLRLLPEAERLGSFITVVTQTKLQPLTTTNAPDVVQWHGNNFRVRTVNDWSDYGQGFYSAVCEMTDMAVA